MEYNTQRKKMELPEYGRSVQNMVDHALTIEDREERQRCANTIVNIMGGMFPHLRDVPDFKHKLWDHLAIMADFKLDIDYPFEIVKREELVMKPENIEYPNGDIRYRHYGRFLEGMVKKAAQIEDETERKQLIRMLAVQMKKSLNNWNKEGIEDQKIVDDLREYSNGLIDLQVEDLELGSQRYHNNNNQRKQNFQRKPQNNQRRKQQH
ncbi:MAG: DUF4290 domain-containing protein [Bacteroidaceae bacterium]|nr:DUF4290 domain-containing protein [Bacteroidaceae bacterium]MBQ4056437.1 DUF4290 domain-containing protein [Bacteroidaceae bacterium]MBR6621902.1 DUF4290 domain-containing protein [Bacteroides sp.]